MSSSQTRSERRSSSPPAAPEGGGVQDELEDGHVGGEDSTFAQLLSEVARAPALPAARLLAHGDRAGEHVIVGPIGRGAFGTVYRAVHPVLGGEVAIKVLSSVYSADPGIAQRFVEEARATHRIRHPNIVELFGFGELPNGQLYYAMELLTGSTLTAQVDARGALEPGLALSVLTQIADALDAAHAHGVLHRDLKPDNIFVVGELGPDCKVKLLDFGIAKLLGDDADSRTRSGMLIGSPGYMSPEQCGGEAVDAKSDIYALGVIAHELLTGQRLFSGDTARELMAQHMFNPVPRASELRRGLPTALDAPLLAMLDKRPALRPASATVAVRALAAAFAGTAPAPSRARRTRARMRWALISVAVIGALWYAQHAYRAHSVRATQQTAVPSGQAASGASAPANVPTGPSRRPVIEHVPLPAPASGIETRAAQPTPEERAVRRGRAVRGAASPASSGHSAPKRLRTELEF